VRSRPGDQKGRFSIPAFDVQFAEAWVGADLDELRVSRVGGDYYLDAKTTRSQLLGRIIDGIGLALFEETLVDGETGRIVDSNVAGYAMPVNADIPDIKRLVYEAMRRPPTRSGSR
jgi:xanthine dehydrogenase YagR molybdenum-binding subunit